MRSYLILLCKRPAFDPKTKPASNLLFGEIITRQVLAIAHDQKIANTIASAIATERKDALGKIQHFPGHARTDGDIYAILSPGHEYSIHRGAYLEDSREITYVLAEPATEKSFMLATKELNK